MAFDKLQQKITSALRNIQGKGKLSERNMEETLKEIRVAFLEADVNYDVTNRFLNQIKEKSLGSKVLDSVEPGQQLIKIVNDELCHLLGSDQDSRLNFNATGLTTIMVVGLQGTGKTTHVAKIANDLKKQGKSVMIIAADVIRPAAIDQIKTLGNSIDVEVYSEGIDVKALKTCENGIKYAKNKNYDVVLIDTAGRLQIDDLLMKELADIKKSCKPQEILLTVDALTGQDVCNVAKTFNDLLSITGLIVTKFDGDSKGGAVLSVKSITGVPIKYTGVGEKIDDLEAFHPDRLANRILGMGDIVSLVEKAQKEFDEKKAEEVAMRMLSGKFTLDDMLFQIDQSTKLGPIGKMMSMIPGLNDYASQINEDEAQKALKKTKAIIQSMTKDERSDPESLRGSHKRRIASGSGTTVDDVNRVINQYTKTAKLMKNMSGLKGMFKM